MRTLFVLVAICISTLSWGQKLKIAPVIGLHMSTVNYSDDFKEALDLALSADNKIKYKPVVSGSFGIWGDYTFSDKIGFRSGLLVNMRGNNIKLKFDDVNVSIKQRYTYLEIPLLVTYQLGDKPFKLLAGPTIGFALSARQKVKGSIEDGDNGGTASASESHKLSIGNDPNEDDIRPIDIGINLGVAKKISLSENPLELSFSVVPSISKHTTQTDLSSDYFGRHFSLGFKLAYFFSIK